MVGLVGLGQRDVLFGLSARKSHTAETRIRTHTLGSLVNQHSSKTDTYPPLNGNLDVTVCINVQYFIHAVMHIFDQKA